MPPPPKKAKTGLAVAVPSSSSVGTSDEPLKLHTLFEGLHGPAWEAPIRKTLEGLPDAAKFIGPDRDKAIVPVRELTFQALKPNPPEAWRVVVFGQNPYPRLESATGIAMFDNAFDSWESKRFGSVVSMRCIIKAAAMVKYGADFKTSVADLRALLKRHSSVTPPQWFQAMLSQGVLLLNAALTTGGEGISATEHNRFWTHVVQVHICQALHSPPPHTPDARRTTPTPPPPHTPHPTHPPFTPPQHPTPPPPRHTPPTPPRPPPPRIARAAAHRPTE